MRSMRSVRVPYFRIWYSTFFILLFLATVFFTLISPSDLIYQSIRDRTFANVFSIAGAYLLTILICTFVWSSRIYTNRATLREIPKSYIPVEDGEIPRKVNKMVVKQWERSAIVAWDERPRDVRKEMKEREDQGGEEQRRGSEERRHTQRMRKHRHGHESTIIPPETALAVWGKISHPGWSSPASDDLPDLQYTQVIRELPNLIEAKAVSLAPLDPAFVQEGLHIQSATNTIPDAKVVTLLQRPRTMGLRDYLAQLDSFRLINPPELASVFLSQYERARFSTCPLTEDQFRELMATFACILSGMVSPEPATIAEALEALEDDRGSARTRSMTPSIHSTTSSRIHHAIPSHAPSSSSSCSNTVPIAMQPSLRQATSRHRTPSTGTILTAPSRMSRAHSHTMNRTRSAASMQSQASSFAGTRTNMSAGSPSSSASLRSARSIVQLTPTPHRPGELPYQFVLPTG